MSFESPSDRLLSSLNRFIFLRRIDAIRLGQTIWIVTLLVYGFFLALQTLRTINLITTFSQATGSGTGLLWLIAGYAADTLSTLIKILLVRLAIEVASRLILSAEMLASRSVE